MSGWAGGVLRLSACTTVAFGGETACQFRARPASCPHQSQEVCRSVASHADTLHPLSLACAGRTHEVEDARFITTVGFLFPL